MNEYDHGQEDRQLFTRKIFNNFRLSELVVYVVGKHCTELDAFFMGISSDIPGRLSALQMLLLAFCAAKG